MVSWFCAEAEIWLDRLVVLGIFVCVFIGSHFSTRSHQSINSLFSYFFAFVYRRMANANAKWSVSEIRLDPHLAVDTSCGSHSGSRGALAWTPPASNEGSTPTWTEGTPSFTDSSSSGEIGKTSQIGKTIVFSPSVSISTDKCFLFSAAFSGSSSPINMSSSDRHKPTVEEALNSLTSEMVSFQ